LTYTFKIFTKLCLVDLAKYVKNSLIRKLTIPMELFCWHVELFCWHVVFVNRDELHWTFN